MLSFESESESLVLDWLEDEFDSLSPSPSPLESVPWKVNINHYGIIIAFKLLTIHLH